MIQFLIFQIILKMKITFFNKKIFIYTIQNYYLYQKKFVLNIFENL